MGINAAGIKSKLHSFKDVLENMKPTVFFLQETKCSVTGKIDVDNYDIYELVPKEKKGGGLAIGVHKDVYSIALNEGDDNVECFSVEISINDINIRLCNAYGPQEADSIERKQNFWEFLDREVDAAEENNSGYLLQFDGKL